MSAENPTERYSAMDTFGYQPTNLFRKGHQTLQ